MTREESRAARGATLALLRRVAGRGLVVSVFRLPASVLGTLPATVEMHAVDVAADPPEQWVARVLADEHADPDHACARLLARAVGTVPEA